MNVKRLGDCAQLAGMAARQFNTPSSRTIISNVPACGFHEWQKTPAGKVPYYITNADETLLAFAGLWDTWRKPDGERLTTFTIITTRVG